MLDIPTLSVAVILVMSMSSLALVAHWLANRSIVGLAPMAAGLTFISIGSGVLFANAQSGAEPWIMLGYVCLLLGQMWSWLGFADFWQARTRMLALIAKTVVLVCAVGLMYFSFANEGVEPKTTLVASGIAILALGCTYTVFQALGGGLGFYKGIVRRTSVGSAMAAGLFLVHAIYAVYHGMARSGFVMPLDTSGTLSLAVSVQMELMLFAIAFALISIIITAERLQAELKIQEMLDPLTKALNRRAFIEVVKAVLARARRNSEPVSLLMIDIDQFKSINAEHGRAVGDETLKIFANMVTEGRRAQDVFCRFGGEEFVFLLPGTPEEGVELVARRIKEKIETSALTPNDVPIQLSISMGIVTERGDDLDADGMLDVVDRRMHNAQKLRFEKVKSA